MASDQRGNAFRVQEVYVKEDTPFEWSPGYQEIQLVQKLNEFNHLSETEHMILVSAPLPRSSSQFRAQTGRHSPATFKFT